MATGSTRTTDLDASIPEVWSAETLNYLAKYLGLLNTVTIDWDGFQELGRYGDKINISKYTDFTAQDKAEDSDVTVQRVTSSNVTVTLDQHKEVTFRPTDVARAFAKPRVMNDMLNNAALVIAEAVEAYVAGLYSGFDIALDASGLTGDNLKAKYYEARRRLVSAKVPQNSPLFAYASQFLVEDLVQTDVMQDASKLGGNARPITDGAIGRFAGFDHFETQAVQTSGSPATQHNLLYAKTALMFVPRMLELDAERFGGAKQGIVTDPRTGLSIRTTMSYNPNRLAPQVTLDVLFGASVLRSEHGIDFQTT